MPKITEPYRARNRAGVHLQYIKNNRAESIIEGMIEHVRISISASLELARALYGYLTFAESFSICCYDVCVRLQNTGSRSRSHARLGTTLFIQRRARQHAVLVILLSQLLSESTEERVGSSHVRCTLSKCSLRSYGLR